MKRTTVQRLKAAQKVLLPLAGAKAFWAVRSQNGLLQLWALLLGGVAIALWITLRVHESNLMGRAERYAQTGRHQDALQLFLDAEQAWALNEVHKTPKTTIKSLKRFLQLLNQIEKEAKILRLAIQTKMLKAVVRELILVDQNPKSYGFDRFHLTSNAEQQVSRISERFAKLRKQFEQDSDKALQAIGCKA